MKDGLRKQDWRVRDGLSWEVRDLVQRYADSGQGHTGAIYRAAGWEEDGTGGGWNYYDPETGRQLSSIADGHFLECPDGWERRHTLKYRFVHRATAASSDASAIQAEEGGSQLTPSLHLSLWEDPLWRTRCCAMWHRQRSNGSRPMPQWRKAALAAVVP